MLPVRLRRWCFWLLLRPVENWTQLTFIYLSWCEKRLRFIQAKRGIELTPIHGELQAGIHSSQRPLTHTHGQSRVSHQPNEHVFNLWEETVAPGENSQTIKQANITQKGSSQESSCESKWDKWLKNHSSDLMQLLQHVSFCPIKLLPVIHNSMYLVFFLNLK